MYVWKCQKYKFLFHRYIVLKRLEVCTNLIFHLSITNIKDDVYRRTVVVWCTNNENIIA